MSRRLRIVNWTRFQADVGNRQWVRLYCDERGTFAMLPLYTRALAAELLKFCDEDGVIEIGEKEPSHALAMLMGARDRSDRGRIKHDLEKLVADGYVVIDGEASANGDQGTCGDRVEHVQARVEHVQSTGRARAEIGEQPRDIIEGEITEERRVEEKREENTTRAREGDPIERTRSHLSRGYGRRYERATAPPGADKGAPWMSASKYRADMVLVAAWCVEANPRSPEAEADLVLDGAFGDEWMRDKRWPWGRIAQDPARFAEAARVERAKAAKVQRVARAEAQREAEERERLRRDEREAVAPPPNARALLDSLTSGIGNAPRGDPATKRRERERELQEQAEQLRREAG